MDWKDSNMIIDEDEMAYVSDTKFKQFGTAVDKALKSFEYSTEWADLISCLGKLNKVGRISYSKSKYSILLRLEVRGCILEEK